MTPAYGQEWDSPQAVKVPVSYEIDDRFRYNAVKSAWILLDPARTVTAVAELVKEHIRAEGGFWGIRVSPCEP